MSKEEDVTRQLVGEWIRLKDELTERERREKDRRTQLGLSTDAEDVQRSLQEEDEASSGSTTLLTSTEKEPGLDEAVGGEPAQTPGLPNTAGKEMTDTPDMPHQLPEQPEGMKTRSRSRIGIPQTPSAAPSTSNVPQMDEHWHQSTRFTERRKPSERIRDRRVSKIKRPEDPAHEQTD